MDAATESDFTSRFGSEHLIELADRDGDDVADSGVFSTHAAAVQSYCRGKVGRMYDLPLETTPAFLIDVQCDMIAYRIAKESRSSLMEEHKEAYSDALRVLEEVACGSMTLGLDDPPDTIQQPSQEGGEERVFTTDDTDGLV